MYRGEGDRDEEKPWTPLRSAQSSDDASRGSGLPRVGKWLGGVPSGSTDHVPRESRLLGVLYKQSRSTFRTTWTKRYFILLPHSLQCFKYFPTSHEIQIPLKVFHLGAQCRLEDIGRTAYKNEVLYTFCIHSKGTKSVMLGSKDLETVAHWMDAIQESIEQSVSLVSIPGRSRDDSAIAESTASLSDEEPETSPLASRSLSMDNIDRIVDEQFVTADSSGASAPFLPAITPLVSSTSIPGRGRRGGGGGRPPEAAGREGQTNGSERSREATLPSNQRLVRRASIGPRGPPVELGGMLETMVAMKSASSVSGIAADGSWQLVKLANGLRFFEERSEVPNVSCGWVPCMSAVGSVEAPSDAIFRLVMDLNATRLEWDVAYNGARVVEEQDGHTDVIHYRMKPLPLGLGPLAMGARDLCVRRYWQRTPDGCYVILYQSIEHRLCPPSGLCVRANLTYGGFIIAPLAHNGVAVKGRSLVMHMLKLEPNGWLPHCAGYPTNVQCFLLSRVAGIREFFAQTQVDAVTSLFGALQQRASFDYTQSASDTSSQQAEEAGVAPSQPPPPPIRPSFARKITQSIPVAAPFLGFSKRIESKKVVDEWSWAEKAASLAKGSPSAGINAWSEADFANFDVRSRTYLQDKVKQPASPPFMSLVAVDWLTRKDRIDHVVAFRPTPVQAARERMLGAKGEGKDFYFFIVNIQVPAVQFYSMVFYFVMDEKPSPDSLMGQFIDGDDVFRNTRFKLIPRIHEGAWVVKRSVGTTPLIVGGALTVRYHSGPDYFECDIDIGSSSVANGIVKFVLGYVRSIVVDMAFLFQANSEDELPEELLGTVRIMHLEPNAAVEIGDDQNDRPKQD